MLRRLMILLLLFVLVYAGVHFWYGRLAKRLLTTPLSGTQPPAAQSVPVRKNLQKSLLPQQKKDTKNNGEQYQSIVSRNIFEAVLVQEGGAEKKTAVKVKEEPKETTLKLVLQGTVSGNERDARAIIVDEKTKKQDLYQVGDAVQGALITAIKRGKVILEFNGRKQFLLIKERKAGAKGIDRGEFMPQPPSSGLQRQESSFSRREGRAPAPVVPHRRISFRPKKPVRRPEQEKADLPVFDEGLPADGASQGLAPELEELNN